MTHSRILSFDLLKAFAIFLVVWGHTIQYLLSSEPNTEPVYRFIYAFHMPLFMMISGYFAASAINRPALPLLRKRFLQLIVPCVVWGVVLYITQLEALSPEHAADYTPAGFTHCLTHWFWFLKSLFCCYVLLVVVKCLRGGWGAWIFVILVSQFLPFLQLRYLIIPFFAGIGLARSGIGQLHPRRWFLLSGFAFAALYLIQPDTVGEAPSLTNSLKSGNYVEALGLLGWRFHRILMGIAGSMCCISFFRWMDFRPNRLTNVLSAIGRQTLGIYILQVLLLEIVLASFLRLDAVSFGMFNFVYSPLLSLLIIALSMALIRLLSAHPLTSHLFLGTASSTRPTTDTKR